MMMINLGLDLVYQQMWVVRYKAGTGFSAWLIATIVSALCTDGWWVA